MDIDPQPITAWFALVLAVGGTVTLISGVIYKINKNFERRVTDLIKETTLPIQAESNGGLSLTDLHIKFDAMDEKVDKLQRHYDHVLAVEEDARELWHQRYIADQRRVKKEWTAVFIAIRKMIHLPVADQVVVWDGITQAYIDGTITEKFHEERKQRDE